MNKKTHFANPERSSASEIALDNKLLKTETSFLDILGAISGITAILDQNRQIIYANEEFLRLLGIDTIELILGRRPGEAVGCINSGDMPSGCGTSKACAYCGAISSILESQLTGKKSVQEARIISVTNGHELYWDLRVTTSPVKIREKVFYVFSIEDISNLKRKENLERIFFHDILNSAGNLNGLISLLKEDLEANEEREIIDLSEESSRELIEEIMVQRQLVAAENGDLVVNSEKVDPEEILKAAVARISRNEISKDKNITISGSSESNSFFTDKVILQRVLINLLKNALEATPKGGTVYASFEIHRDEIRYRVKNETVMTEAVRLQVFQRSFSTKGTGRGLGIYSIKLLTEHYLKGTINFTSAEPDGTIFFIDLPLNYPV